MPRKNERTIKSTVSEDGQVEVNGDETDTDDEPKPIDKATASALLAAYVSADNNVTKLEESVDTAKKARSEACKEIHDALGKGPFKYKDAYLGKIVVRDGNYFFRGKIDQELMSFD